jgi:prepilin-type N-terminal cleavage/methylation domain-containing protein
MKSKFIYKTRKNIADSSSAGFTMVELMIVMVIMLLVASAVYNILGSLSRSYTGQNVAADTQQDMRIGIDYMVRSIRMAGLDPHRTGKPGVLTAVSDEFSFTTDQNMDGDPDDTGEQITFSYSDNRVRLTDDFGTITLNDDVTGFSFTYLDEDDAVTSQIDHIRSVLIDMTVRSPAGNHKPIQRTSSTRVRCRNLGL